MKTAPLPAIPEMDWSLPTPRSREIVWQIGLRLVAGYSLDEIAVMVEAERPERAAAVRSVVIQSWYRRKRRQMTSRYPHGVKTQMTEAGQRAWEKEMREAGISVSTATTSTITLATKRKPRSESALQGRFGRARSADRTPFDTATCHELATREECSR